MNDGCAGVKGKGVNVGEGGGGRGAMMNMNGFQTTRIPNII